MLPSVQMPAHDRASAASSDEDGRHGQRDLIVHPTAYTANRGFPDPADIIIYDTTLRDGEQTPGVAFTPQQKCELAIMASRIGCHVIEMGFPGGDDTDDEALNLICAARRRGLIRRDVELCALSRARPDDIDRTLRAVMQAGESPTSVRLLLFTSGSDLHIKLKLAAMLLRREGRDESELANIDLAWLREATGRLVSDSIRHARSLGFDKISFGAEDSSRTPIEQVLALAKVGFDAGAERYILADTTGSLTPEATELMFSRLRAAFPGKLLGCHLHNDFDLATINTIVACRNGARELTITFNGLGERAGNAPLHTLVIALRELYGVELPGFQYHLLQEATRLAERFAGIAIPPNEPVVGDNIFAHESGIHVHGVIKDPLTYEPIAPDLVGGKRRLVYGKHSGRHAVWHALETAKARLVDRGIIVTEELVTRVVQHLKARRLRRAEAGTAEHGVRIAREMFQSISFSPEDVVSLAEQLHGSDEAPELDAAGNQTGDARQRKVG